MVHYAAVIRSMIVLGALLVAGCTDTGERASDGPLPAGGEQSSDTGGDNATADVSNDGAVNVVNRTRTLVLSECRHAEFAATDASLGFPYPAPADWEDPATDVRDAVLMRMFDCGIASAFGLQTFHGASMAWFGHGNMTDNEGRLDEYFYNDLVGEIAIVAHPPELAELIRSEFQVVDGESTIDLDEGTATLELPAGRLELALNQLGVPGSARYEETVFFVNATGERYLRVSHSEDGDGLWLPGTLQATGKTPLDLWMDRTTTTPSVDGYLAPNGTVEVTVFG